MAATPWPDESVFEPFNTFEEVFKTVSSHEIKAAIFIPKGIQLGSHPIIFLIHGGFLATGHSLFAPFIPPWTLKLALEKSAVIVSPDYRLLPTTNGVADILEDLEDAWQWAKFDLPKILETKAPGHALDFSRLLIAGSSAGGYCAIQLALSHSDEVAAVGTTYPLVDLKDKIYVEGPGEGEPNVLRFPSEDIPSKEDTIQWIEDKRKTITTKAGIERTPFCVSSCHHGLFASKLLDNKGLGRTEFSPPERIRNGAKLPRALWILQGDDDSATHIRATNAMVDLVKTKLPETLLRYDVVQGQDHAFDIDPSTWESFSKQALEFVADPWIRA